MEDNRTERTPIPVHEKACLSVTEPAEYSGIGRSKIRQLADEEGCNFVIWDGNKRLIKRKKFEEFLENAFSI